MQVAELIGRQQHVEHQAKLIYDFAIFNNQQKLMLTALEALAVARKLQAHQVVETVSRSVYFKELSKLIDVYTSSLKMEPPVVIDIIRRMQAFKGQVELINAYSMRRGGADTDDLSVLKSDEKAVEIVQQLSNKVSLLQVAQSL